MHRKTTPLTRSPHAHLRTASSVMPSFSGPNLAELRRLSRMSQMTYRATESSADVCISDWDGLRLTGRTSP